MSSVYRKKSSGGEGLRIKLVSGNGNRPLAEEISKELRVDLVKGVCKRFADHEIFVELHDNVRGEDVFVIQSTSHPANDNLMELLILIDALKRASARRPTCAASSSRRATPNRPVNSTFVYEYSLMHW